MNPKSNRPTEWPELDFTEMQDTIETLHQWVQIVGKIRLKTMPWQNHSWHTTLYPAPEAFAKQEVLPEQAYYSPEMGEFFLNYSDVQKADNPEKMLYDFLATTYNAAAKTANWDRELLERSL